MPLVGGIESGGRMKAETKAHLEHLIEHHKAHENYDCAAEPHRIDRLIERPHQAGAEIRTVLAPRQIAASKGRRR